MKTTIQVSQRTHLMLKALKEKWNASSYDEVIQKYAKTHLKSLESLAGAFPNLRKWNREEDRMKFRGE